MLIQGSAFHLPLPDQSVHSVICSPPYWGLRSYSGEQGEEPLGLEPTPERHIERTVEWAREVSRVLRDDGVFWLNYGDCYAGTGGENGNGGLGMDTSERHGNYRQNPRARTVRQGNLMLMPHRIALALQADGWIIRQDLVWAKPNPMPESVGGWDYAFDRISAQLRRNETRIEKGKKPLPIRDGWHGRVPEWLASDLYETFKTSCGEGGWLTLGQDSWRHTRSHEYVFQLVKSMGYWSNQEAVREAVLEASQKRAAAGFKPIAGDEHNHYGDGFIRDGKPHQFNGRNPRSVLNVPTSPYKGAHYATFPPALIAPLIQATCPRWCCPVCGQGWALVVEKGYRSSIVTTGTEEGRYASGRNRNVVRMGDGVNNTIFGRRPTCDHPHTQAEAVSGIVCDPFVGSGTTVMVARQLLRRGIGLDISRPYLAEQATLRIGDVPMQDHAGLPLFGGNGHG